MKLGSEHDYGEAWCDGIFNVDTRFPVFASYHTKGRTFIDLFLLREHGRLTSDPARSLSRPSQECLEECQTTSSMADSFLSPRFSCLAVTG
jgi:hypothetical protein